MDDAPHRRRGRPPIDPTDPSVNIQVRIPSKQYDRLYHTAALQRVSLADLVRAAITAQLRRP